MKKKPSQDCGRCGNAQVPDNHDPGVPVTDFHGIHDPQELPVLYGRDSIPGIDKFRLAPKGMSRDHHGPLVVHKLAECALYNKLKETCSEEVVQLLPCRDACVTACKVLHQDLDLDALVTMEADMNKDGYCEFHAKKV
ncbi:hypothetical protein ACFL0Q_08770 [Thermodesulfobacteriota bacterium]